MRIATFSHGSDTCYLTFADHPSDSYAEWYRALNEAIDTLEHDPRFSVARPRSGDFVNSGVPCLFLGKSFELWSDAPGEVIVHFETLRPRHSEELVAALMACWNHNSGLHDA